MDEDKPLKRPILDGYRLATDPYYEMENRNIPFEPLNDEEFLGPCREISEYSPIWRPIIEIACESTFRGFLGGEKPGEGWFFSTADHFKFRIAELSHPGIGAYLSLPNFEDRDNWLWIEFFKESSINRIFSEVEDENIKSSIYKFALTTRALIAEMFRMRLSERTLVLAGRIGSPVQAPSMIEHDQLNFLTVTDWKLGIGEFVTGEPVYSLRAAYSRDLNSNTSEYDEHAETVTLRARKARAVMRYLEINYPQGVPESVSAGALANSVAVWLRSEGFDDSVSDKTVYRVRRAYNISRQHRG